MALAEQLRPLLAETALDAHALPAKETGASAAVFRRDGEYWRVQFEGDAFAIRDSRGMHHLARLLEAPGHEVHALELASANGDPLKRPVGASVGLGVDPMTGIGPVIDAEAKAAYRTRVSELREEIAEAESWNDPERTARATEELHALTDQLAAAAGLGGRARPIGSAAERARVSVTRAIRASVNRLGQQSASLGAHLALTIRTGTYCSYMPDPRAPISWDTGRPTK
jgi:hypothetical protein